MIVGIVCGVGAAVGQSLSYLATRHYVQQRSAGATRQLLVLGHVWMGLLSAAALPLCWPAAGIPWNTIAYPLLMNVLFYISAIFGQMMALKHAEASRFSPLLTSKLILSSILVMIYGQPVGGTAAFLSAPQWLAVLLCLVAAVAINTTGGRMKTTAVVAVLWTAANYSISDWYINRLLAALVAVPGIDRFHASLLTQMLGYTMTGVLALPFLPLMGSRKGRDWTDAFPYAALWFVAMIGLFYSFSTVGIIFGSILQSTRGFISILLAAAIMKMGHHHIEPPAPRRILLQRLAAGVLMFGGICLYVLTVPQTR
jgi:drug/metabolite transporter (DMT)-like permease